MICSKHSMGGKLVSEQSKTVLFIDVGNTAAKYTIINTDTITNIGLADIDLLIDTFAVNESPVKLLSSVNSIYLSYVRVPVWLESLKLHATAQQVPIHIAKTEKHIRINHSILTNSYSDISTMGIDRWLAMIATVGLYPKKSDFVIVDAGTAITCDVIFRHAHIGGWIAPGLSSIKNSLLNNTENVFKHDNEQANQKLMLGKNTPDCVEYGCLAQLNGIVNEGIKQINALSDNYLVIISGGDREKIFQQEKNDTVYKANIVLLGLIQLAKNHQIS